MNIFGQDTFTPWLVWSQNISSHKTFSVAKDVSNRHFPMWKIFWLKKYSALIQLLQTKGGLSWVQTLKKKCILQIWNTFSDFLFWNFSFWDHPFKMFANFTQLCWPLLPSCWQFLLLSVGQFHKLLSPSSLKSKKCQRLIWMVPLIMFVGLFKNTLFGTWKNQLTVKL